MSNVVDIGCQTKLEIPADKVLLRASELLKTVIVLGYDSEGREYFASSTPDPTQMLWLIERFKAHLFRDEDDPPDAAG